MNLGLWLQRTASLQPDAPALLRGSQIVASYAQMAQRVAAMAAGLVDRYGIGPGDRVAIFMPNRTEYLELMYAVWYAGAVVVPINAKLHPNEAAWMTGNAEARIIVVDSKQARAMELAVADMACSVIDVESDDFLSLYGSSPMAAPIDRTRQDLAWLFYTSGTTGRPKGVMLSNENLEVMALSYFADVDAVEHGDANIYAAPISHGAGLYNFMFAMRGARHVVPVSGGFEADEIIDLAAELDNVCMFAAPTMVRRLVTAAKQRKSRVDGFKTIVYGGGPMYLADILEAVDVIGPHFAQIYAQGECPMTITALSKEMIARSDHPGWQRRLATVGRAFSSVEVAVVDMQGRECAEGQVGEVIVRGSPVMQGYWRDEDATSKTLKDGWLWTGDLGAMDDEGFLTLHDRSKDVIISGGTNIYPREVEEVLLSHSSVAQVAVIGQQDAEWGEIVVAFVVSEAEGDCDPAILDAHCIENIARFKRPKHYAFVQDLPKNAYGKVIKAEMRTMQFGGYEERIDSKK